MKLFLGSSDADHLLGRIAADAPGILTATDDEVDRAAVDAKCCKSPASGGRQAQAYGYPVLRCKNANVFWLNSLTFW
jgi:hypothetical protein